MSFLANPYVLIPTISLVIQIIVLALLIYGYWLNRRLAFPQHGKIMAIAVIFHLIVIFAVMVPSFVLAVVPEYVIPRLSNAISIIALVHVPLGIVAALLGAWFAIAWRLQGLKGCFNRRRLMLLTMIIWFTSLSLGIALYALFYWPF